MTHFIASTSVSADRRHYTCIECGPLEVDTPASKLCAQARARERGLCTRCFEPLEAEYDGEGEDQCILCRCS
jgi:hypothetical protein